MMNKTHWLLCEADEFAAARSHVLKFFRNSMLLHYDVVTVVEEYSFTAGNQAFWLDLDRGIIANQTMLRGFIDELQKEGCQDLADVTKLAMGYPSKLLHIIAHLVDGFIGIDSVFYNLMEDSHWLSDSLRKSIMEAPFRYWLVRVDASFKSLSSAALIHQVPM